MYDSAKITLLTIAVVFVFAVGALAVGTDEVSADDSGSAGDDIIWSYNSTSKALTITGAGDMYDWDFTDSPWYSYGNEIESVTIGDGITSIGDWAFFECTALTSVTIPGGVTVIGDHAFGCTGLTAVDIPAGVTSIENDAFMSCSALETVTIPNSVTSIGEGVFYECTLLETIVIPDSVTTMGYSVFSECWNLKFITIGTGITSISDYLFYNCIALETIVIPDNVTAIGTSAFTNCTSLTSMTFEGEGLSFGSNAFLLSGTAVDTDVYRYDETLDITDYSERRNLTYHKIYRISYMDGEDVLHKQYLPSGEAPSTYEAPEKEEHTFVEWDPAIPAAMPEGDVTTSAVWSANQYTITFNSAGGSPVSAITQDYGTAITAPASPTREGYVFAGWSPAIPGTMPAEDMTVTAVWTEAEPAPSDSGSDMLLYAGTAAAAVTALAIAAVFIRRR